MKKVTPANQFTTDLPMDELAAPAQRALANAGIKRLKQFATFSEEEIKQLHGIGPNALKQLQHALKVNGLSFSKAK